MTFANQAPSLQRLPWASMVLQSALQAGAQFLQSKCQLDQIVCLYSWSEIIVNLIFRIMILKIRFAAFWIKLAKFDGVFLQIIKIIFKQEQRYITCIDTLDTYIKHIAKFAAYRFLISSLSLN